MTIFRKRLLRELGYHLYVSGQKAYNGVAIFSRTPLETVSIGFAEIMDDFAELDEQKRVITGVVGNVRIINLYVPNGAAVDSDKYDYKLRWLKALREYLQRWREQSSAELCVCGDFNIALEDRDIYDPSGKEKHIMSSPAERQALQAVLAVGLQDAFRKVYG